MPVVGTALRSDLQTGSTESPILRVVAVGDDLDVIYGVFIGGDDGGSAPDGADGADAVDADAVAGVLRAVCDDLRIVLSLKDACAAGGASGAGGAGKVVGASA